MTLSTLSMVRPACICFIAVPAFFIASSVSLLMFALSILEIWPSSVIICALVCSSECSCCFLRRSAALAAALFDDTYFRASASCSSIWFCRCFSRLFSISSCPRSCRIAFFGASFFAAPPPNQPSPQPDMVR